jgi:hypothetical protein
MGQERFRPEDTAPEVWTRYLELLRTIPPQERLLQAFELSDTVRRLSEAGVRASYPHADDREFRFRLAQRWIGPDLAEQVLGRE